MKKQLQDLRGMSKRDLLSKIVDLEEGYFKLRCDNRIGQLTDKSALKKARRNIARAKTVLLERETTKEG